MNRLEFNTVMNLLKIKKGNRAEYPSGGWYVYQFNELKIAFLRGSDYAMIDGKIPLEVANIIYEKYPGNPYKIRVDGGCNDWNPKNYDKGGYIETYHIDTKEGLLIFMLEMFDYYARKNELPEIFVKQYQNYLNAISLEILKVVNPGITVDEWMKGAKNFRDDDKDSYLLYLEAISSENDTLDKEIRKALIKFDEAINPFQNERVRLEEFNDVFETLEVSGNIFNIDNGMYRENCAMMYLSDTETENCVKYTRSPDGFYYTVTYDVSQNNTVKLIHYFANHCSDDFDNGEVIVIVEHKNSGYVSIRYNINQGKFGETHGKKEPITQEQKRFILGKLNEAIKYASSITVDKVKSYEQKKVLKK